MDPLGTYKPQQNLQALNIRAEIFTNSLWRIFITSLTLSRAPRLAGVQHSDRTHPPGSISLLTALFYGWLSQSENAGC